jgi:hypothetical protein
MTLVDGVLFRALSSHLPSYVWWLFAATRARLSLLSLHAICQSWKSTFESLDEPVSEAVPKVPSSNPVLLIDIGHVATQVVVRSRMRTGIVDNRQNLEVFRRLGNFVPFVGCSHGRVSF